MKPLLRILFWGVLPLAIFEGAILGFYLVFYGTDTLANIHRIAWGLDLSVLVPVLCVILLALAIVQKYVLSTVPTDSHPERCKCVDCTYDRLSAGEEVWW